MPINLPLSKRTVFLAEEFLFNHKFGRKIKFPHMVKWIFSVTIQDMKLKLLPLPGLTDGN